MIKRRYIVGIILALLMLCAAVTAADAVSAAKYKKFDSGKAKSNDGIIKYTTFYNGKTVKMVNKVYTKNSKYVGSMTFYISKYGKNQLKAKIVTRVKGYPVQTKNSYEKTKLSPKTYYNKKIKPSLK